MIVYLLKNNKMEDFHIFHIQTIQVGQSGPSDLYPRYHLIIHHRCQFFDKLYHFLSEH